MLCINDVDEGLEAIKIEKLLGELFFLEARWAALMNRQKEWHTLMYFCRENSDSLRDFSSG